MRFQLLGPLEVHVDGRPVALGGPQQQTVLAVLLVEAGRVVSAERLADQLWGERPPSTARNLLQGCVSGLRRALGGGVDGVLRTRPPGYLLRVDGAEVDAVRFEELARQAAADAEAGALDVAAGRYAEALALWRGSALDGIAAPACRAEAGRLEERRLVVLERRIDVDLRRGLHVELVPELQALARDHPVRERFWAQLVTALHRCDRRGEALEAYRRVREVLAEELGIEPGPALRDLYREVVGGRQTSTVDTADGTVDPRDATDDRTPRQLPPAVPAFTGREALLRRLDGLLDLSMGVGLAVVCGSAGVGKTALAVQWAHRVRHRFDGGQFHVNLNGYATTAPLRPIEALEGFLRALGVPPEQIPTDEAHATALYRTLLARRRVLVVLDNARTPEQVRPLVPGGPGSVVLVTSRSKLGGLVAHDGAASVPVDVLTGAEATQLFTRLLGAARVGAEPDAVDTLVAQCARLPLALRIAAANLTLAPDRPVADLVAELAEGSRLAGLAVDGSDTSAVRAAFDLSYEGQPPAARRLFRLLGTVPGTDVTAETAAALAGVDRAVALRLLRRLADAHLLDAHRPGRYTCHDLLRGYAVERADAEDPAPERESALRRWYRHHLERARAAADVLYPHMLRLPENAGPRARASDKDETARAWLEAERRNLVLAVRAAATTGPPAMAWRLADALRGWFHLRRYTADWMSVGAAALAAAERARDPHGVVSARHSLGTAHRSLGAHAEAMTHYVEALRVARECGWAEAEATTLGNLGIVCQLTGRLHEAVGHLEAALEVDRRTGRRTGEANNLANLGDVQLEFGRLDDAVRSFTAALDLHTAGGSVHGQALALTGLGRAYLGLRRHDRAATHLTGAADRYARVGDRDGVAVIDCFLGLLECARDRPDAARRHGLAALGVARDTGDRRTEAMALLALGAADQLTGRPADAARRYRAAHDLGRRTASRRLQGEALVGLATAHRDLGRHGEAAAFATRALTLADRNGYGLVGGNARAVLATIAPAPAQ